MVRSTQLQRLTITELREAVPKVKNKSALEKLLFGHRRAGRPNALLRLIKEHKIDTAHWTGVYIKKPSLSVRKKPLEKLSQTQLKRRIREDNLLEYVCSSCGLFPEWQGRYLTLHLDHINGDNRDGRLDNLRYLCPNCHQQTKTWGFRDNRLPREDEVLQEMAKTMTYSEIAEFYHVDPSTVSHRLRKYYE